MRMPPLCIKCLDERTESTEARSVKVKPCGPWKGSKGFTERLVEVLPEQISGEGLGSSPVQINLTIFIIPIHDHSYLSYMFLQYGPFGLPKDERKFAACIYFILFRVRHPSEHSTLTQELQETAKELKLQREQINQHDQGALTV